MYHPCCRTGKTQPNKILCNPSVSNAFSAAATNLPPVAGRTEYIDMCLFFILSQLVLNAVECHLNAILEKQKQRQRWIRLSELTSIVLQKVLHHFIGTLCPTATGVQHPKWLKGSTTSTVYVPQCCIHKKHFGVLCCKTWFTSIHHGYRFPLCSPTRIRPKHECERSITTLISA